MVVERGHTEAFDKGWGEAARAKGQGRSELGCAALDGMAPSSTGRVGKGGYGPVKMAVFMTPLFRASEQKKNRSKPASAVRSMDGALHANPRCARAARANALHCDSALHPKLIPITCCRQSPLAPAHKK